MKKRVFLIHGWDDTPEDLLPSWVKNAWFSWLKRELEAKDFEVYTPQLPDAGSPRIFKWIPAISEIVGIADENTYFVGHSMGCQAIARYLETLPENVIVGGVVFVAGFFKHLSNLEDDDDVRETDKHWLQTPLDLEKVKSHIRKSVAIFSDDDPFVPLDNQDAYQDILKSEIIIEHAKGHFSGGRDKTTELPIVLDKLLEISE